MYIPVSPIALQIVEWQSPIEKRKAVKKSSLSARKFFGDTLELDGTDLAEVPERINPLKKLERDRSEHNQDQSIDLQA